MKKRIIALLAIVAIVAACGAFVLTACDGGDDTFKVGVVHIGDPKDGGYSGAHDAGIVKMQKNLGLKDSQIVRQININDGDNAAIRTAVENCIAQGCKIIFTTSFGYGDVTQELAKKYPDIYFSHGTGYLDNANMNNYFGRIYQARYLTGIAAGLKTTTDNIGYVSAYGMDMAETCSGISAFAMGVAAVNPDAKVYVKKLNSWFDPANEKGYAEDLIKGQNCDVIAQHCDTAGPQVAAQETHKSDYTGTKVYGCGYNADMTEDAPDAHLCATVWDWSVYYTAAVKAAMNGTFGQGEGKLGNYYGSMKDGLVKVSPITANAAENTEEIIEKVTKMIVDGEWDVFSGVALEIDQATAEVLKVERALTISYKDGGATKSVTLEAGDNRVDDAIIKGSMSWYYTNVVEV